MALLSSEILASKGGRTKTEWVPLRGNWNNYLWLGSSKPLGFFIRIPSTHPQHWQAFIFIFLAATCTRKHKLGWLPSTSCPHFLKELSSTEYQNTSDFKILSLSWVLALHKYRLLLRWYWSFQLPATCPYLYYVGNDQCLLCLIAFLTVNEK